MNKPTLEGFYQFINTQDYDRKINHISWKTCAGGEYLRGIGIGIGGSGVCMSLHAEFMIYESEEGRCLFNKLNLNHFDTYGELQEYVNKA